VIEPSFDLAGDGDLEVLGVVPDSLAGLRGGIAGIGGIGGGGGD